jgi:uncharacterized membrane protein
MKTRTIRSVVYLAAGIGLIVAIFAAAEFFEASLRSFCTVNTFFSCAAVDNSGRTTTLGIPDYLWGIGGFLAILVVAGLAESRRSDPRYTYVLLGVTTAGVALSLYLLYVELALIGALCLVCASAYTSGAIAWVASIPLALRAHRKSKAAMADDAAAEPSVPVAGSEPP